MSSRSLNKVQLIGNLTRDPELRYTPNGAAVCTIGLATNRSWMTDAGERKEETEFHRVVAWNKLAELCSQLLTKGRKVYFEGRLRTTSWQGQDGATRYSTEIVADDMILLDSRRPVGEEGAPGEALRQSSGQETPATPAMHAGPVNPNTAGGDDTQAASTIVAQPAVKKSKKEDKSETTDTKPTGAEDVNPDDIPF